MEKTKIENSNLNGALNQNSIQNSVQNSIQKSKQNQNKKAGIYKLSFSAVCVALAFVCRMFLEIMVPFFGSGSIRISAEGIFLALPAMLFGGVYGGFCFMCVDLLGVVFKPEGAFISYLSIAMFAYGFLKGVLFKYFCKYKKHIDKIYIAVTAATVLFGTVNSFINKSKVAIWSVPLIMGAVLTVLFILIKAFKIKNDIFKPILLMQIISGCFVSIINSVILYVLLIAGGKSGFYIFSTVRLLKETVVAVITAAIITVIYKKVLTRLFPFAKK